MVCGKWEMGNQIEGAMDEVVWLHRDGL